MAHSKKGNSQKGRAITVLVVGLLIVASVCAGLLLPGYEGPGQSLVGQVVKVVDGDTFELQAGSETFTVEMIGIDAPEFGQAFGQYARQYLADLVEHRSVTVRIQDRNGYGELNGELFLDGVSINQLLLTDGFAWAKRGMFEDAKWVGLEHLARNNGFGLWRNDHAVPPWEFRDRPVHMVVDG